MNRSNAVALGLLAAILIPRIQKWTGVVLTTEDVAELMAGGYAAFHAAAAVFERYFPPPRAASTQGDSKSVNP